MTNAHLKRYLPGDEINITLEKKFSDVMAYLFG